MSHVPSTTRLDEVTSNQNTFREFAKNPVVITLLVIGILLSISAIVMYTQQVNTHAVTIVGAIGGIFIATLAATSVLSWCRSNKGSENIVVQQRNAIGEDVLEHFEQYKYSLDEEGVKRDLAQLQMFEKEDLLSGVAKKSEPFMVSMLMKEGVNPLKRIPDSLDWPALFLPLQDSVTCLTLPTLKSMLKVYPHLIHAKNENHFHRSLLHHAVMQPDLTGWPARFLKQEQSDRRKIVTYLLEKGLDINMRDARGDTPLHIALRCSVNSTKPDIEMIELLIAKGTKWTIANKKKLTARDLLQKNPNLKEWRESPEISDRLAKLG